MFAGSLEGLVHFVHGRVDRAHVIVTLADKTSRLVAASPSMHSFIPPTCPCTTNEMLSYIYCGIYMYLVLQTGKFRELGYYSCVCGVS